jgi:hypothetical protein
MKKILIIAENHTFKVGEIVEVSDERADSAVTRKLAEYVKEKKETKKSEKL